MDDAEIWALIRQYGRQLKDGHIDANDVKRAANRLLDLVQMLHHGNVKRYPDEV